MHPVGRSAVRIEVIRIMAMQHLHRANHTVKWFRLKREVAVGLPALRFVLSDSRRQDFVNLKPVSTADDYFSRRQTRLICLPVSRLHPRSHLLMYCRENPAESWCI